MKTRLLIVILVLLWGDRGSAVIAQTLPDFVPIEGDTFYMGDEWGAGYDDERPVHRVVLSGFRVALTEVTVQQYRAFCTEMGVSMPRLPQWAACDDCPMTRVSWYDAMAYGEWLSTKVGKNCRLPTEAEWEYVAKGGQKRPEYMYSGALTPDTVAWTRENSNNRPQPVGTKRPNALGIYDLSGNVREWCMDYYQGDYYRVSATLNPAGPEEGRCRVVRGGAWQDAAADSRSTYRSCSKPSQKHLAIGFRVVQTE